MNTKAARRILLVVVSLAVIAAVGVAAYQWGLSNGPNDTTTIVGRGFRGPMMDRDMGHTAWGFAGPGMGWIGLIVMLLLGLLFVWLILAAVSGPRGSAAPSNSDAAGIDRLRGLSEMHARGELTDDEFAAAKRKLLGL
jgi:uncharacterized membrane protein